MGMSRTELCFLRINSLWWLPQITFPHTNLFFFLTISSAVWGTLDRALAIGLLLFCDAFKVWLVYMHDNLTVMHMH